MLVDQESLGCSSKQSSDMVYFPKYRFRRSVNALPCRASPREAAFADKQAAASFSRSISQQHEADRGQYDALP